MPIGLFCVLVPDKKEGQLLTFNSNYKTMKNLKTVFASMTLILFISASVLPVALGAEECTPTVKDFPDEKNKWFGGCKDKTTQRCVIKVRCPRDLHIHIKI